MFDYTSSFLERSVVVLVAFICVPLLLIVLYIIKECYNTLRNKNIKKPIDLYGEVSDPNIKAIYDKTVKIDIECFYLLAKSLKHCSPEVIAAHADFVYNQGVWESTKDISLINLDSRKNFYVVKDEKEKDCFICIKQSNYVNGLTLYSNYTVDDLTVFLNTAYNLGLQFEYRF